MLACCPPHSGPQFTIHACVLSLLKNPNTGRSNPGMTVQTAAGGGLVRQVEFCCPGKMLNGETMVTESELSLKTSSLLPSPFCTTWWAPGIGTVPLVPP